MFQRRFHLVSELAGFLSDQKYVFVKQFVPKGNRSMYSQPVKKHYHPSIILEVVSPTNGVIILTLFTF